MKKPDKTIAIPINESEFLTFNQYGKLKPSYEGGQQEPIELEIKLRGEVIKTGLLSDYAPHFKAFFS